MITNLTKQDLIDFEQDILECFENKEIKAPVHLAGGNEDQLIQIFQDVQKQDWVCTTWRSHYECLLRGVPPELVKQKILDGHSISLCFKDYKVISSAIVGGICPIALGLAVAVKEQKKDEHIWIFIGDMSFLTGINLESYNYALWHDLPITWVIADNNRSVCTPTNETWGYKQYPYANKEKVIYYQYKPTFPHHGSGQHVIF